MLVSFLCQADTRRKAGILSHSLPAPAIAEGVERIYALVDLISGKVLSSFTHMQPGFETKVSRMAAAGCSGKK